MSLIDLESTYKKKPEWKIIEEGGVWSVPVEEFRMQNPPHADARGNIDFEKKKAGESK